MNIAETIAFTVAPPHKWLLEEPPWVIVTVKGLRAKHSWTVTSIHTQGLPPMTDRSWWPLLRLIRQHLQQTTGLRLYNVDREAVAE